MIRGFECIDVIFPVGITDHQRKQTLLQENQRGQGACHSAIAILERVNPGEPMI